MKTQVNTMPVNYQDGKVYTVINDINDIIYTGSTAQKFLSSRMSCHRRHATDINRNSGLYTAMRTLGVGHFRIILHHVFPCNSKDELVAEEMKTLDALIASGKPVYNNVIGGKADDVTRAKISAAKKERIVTDATRAKNSAVSKGNTYRFSFGSICLSTKKGGLKKWVFLWYIGDTQRSKSFSCKKYGDYGAHWRAEQVRREVYPEWGSEEDCTCDDFGEIEWD